MNAPFPVTKYQSTIHVKEDTDGKTFLVEWSGSFNPVVVSDEVAIKLFPWNLQGWHGEYF
ncbi:hypothetical protein J6TS2_51630 [Heyndrickxia sporothermodurans]|nr:hypothetical protein J6TS2_51630 [Heyndrickxia sporothermodurans]